jgi:transposase
MDTNASRGVTIGGRGRRGEPPRAGRKSHTLDEKQRMVAESYEPGASVSRVARRHEINANLLFTWRRQLREPPRLAPPVEFIPVDIVSEQAAPHTVAVEAERRWAIEITLISGVRVRVDGCQAPSWKALPQSACWKSSGAGNIRARMSSAPARPYIARLRVFKRLICPSVWPLLQHSVSAFLTASISCRSVRTKHCMA